jgi:hypothetical protein
VTKSQGPENTRQRTPFWAPESQARRLRPLKTREFPVVSGRGETVRKGVWRRERDCRRTFSASLQQHWDIKIADYSDFQKLLANQVVWVSEGDVVGTIYQDPPAEVGTVEDAIGSALISTLDPSPMSEAETNPIL